MLQADRLLGRLVRFARSTPGYQIWVATSMGQRARKAGPVARELHLVDVRAFMSTLGLGDAEWRSRRSMVPQVNLIVDGTRAAYFRSRLGALAVGGRPIVFRESANGFFSIDFGHPNLSSDDCVGLDGQPIALQLLGLRNEPIQDSAGLSADHIPEGCLIVYDPRWHVHDGRRPEISTLDIAPSILRNYAVKTPGYMNRPLPLGG
jgi:hypothetical protein